MDVFSPTLSECPWVPVIGNHEVNDGDNFQRYLNMTWGETEKDDDENPVFHSTADSRLGELLTRTTLLGAGIHSGRSAGSGSGVPSNTSQYFSVNIGRVHLCGLDLNGGKFDANQTAWLEADLASVDRDATPWVVLTSHFPLVHPSMFQPGNFSAAYYRGEGSENFATSGHAFKQVACEADTGLCAEETVREQQQTLQASLVTILDYYHVDLYIAGHVHDYATMWPQCYDELTGAISACKDAKGNVIQSFDQPLGTVHITEGNGGVPGCNGTVAPDNATINHDASFNCGDVESCRTWFTGCAHGRLVAVDANTMRYEHVSNKDGKVYDSLTITKTHSAPFRTHSRED